MDFDLILKVISTISGIIVPFLVVYVTNKVTKSKRKTEENNKLLLELKLQVAQLNLKLAEGMVELNHRDNGIMNAVDKLGKVVFKMDDNANK